jgi:hypothetical protein
MHISTTEFAATQQRPAQHHLHKDKNTLVEVAEETRRVCATHADHLQLLLPLTAQLLPQQHLQELVLLVTSRKAMVEEDDDPLLDTVDEVALRNGLLEGLGRLAVVAGDVVLNEENCTNTGWRYSLGLKVQW